MIDLTAPFWIFGALDSQSYPARGAELLTRVLLVRWSTGGLADQTGLPQLDPSCLAADSKTGPLESGCDGEDPRNAGPLPVPGSWRHNGFRKPAENRSRNRRGLPCGGLARASWPV